MQGGVSSEIRPTSPAPEPRVYATIGLTATHSASTFSAPFGNLVATIRLTWPDGHPTADFPTALGDESSWKAAMSPLIPFSFSTRRNPRNTLA